MRATSKLLAALVAAVVSLSVLYAAPATARPAPQESASPVSLESCRDPLVKLLYRSTGWRNRDLRMAWAIAMRESHGQEDLVSGEDYGLFQLNKKGWGQTPYWTEDPLHGWENAKAAFAMWMDYGWIPWGHNRNGSTNVSHYGKWTDEQVREWITVPFRKWYRAFPSECSAWLRLS